MPDMAGEVVVKRDRDGKPLAPATSADGLHELNRRNDSVVAPEVMKLPPEDTAGNRSEDLQAGVPPVPADAVVDDHDPRARRRHARKPANQKREHRPRRVTEAHHVIVVRS